MKDKKHVLGHQSSDLCEHPRQLGGEGKQRNGKVNGQVCIDVEVPKSHETDGCTVACTSRYVIRPNDQLPITIVQVKALQIVVHFLKRKNSVKVVFDLFVPVLGREKHWEKVEH